MRDRSYAKTGVKIRFEAENLKKIFIFAATVSGPERENEQAIPKACQHNIPFHGWPDGHYNIILRWVQALF